MSGMSDVTEKWLQWNAIAM